MLKINQRIPPQTGYINNNYNNIRTYNIFNNNSEEQKLNQKITQRNNININSKVKCTCSKTGCTKKYCACFSKGILCDGCECKNCENCVPKMNNQLSPISALDSIIKGEKMLENEDYNNKKENIPKTQRVICNCTKSNCMKKYCECFKQGFNCNSLCRCLDCKNKIYISNLSDLNDDNNNINNININNENPNYNLNTNLKNNNNNSNSIINNNDFINNNNNFYNYALHNNINNNIINNNIINTPSYIPETFGKSVDYSNPINFQPEAFGIYIKKEKLKIDTRKINLIYEKEITNKNNINNNIEEINETPKFSNKKRLRTKNENSTSVKTCPTTNSSNKLKKAISVVNKNIKKKKLQLN